MISTRNCPHGDRGRKKWTSLQDWQGNEKVTTTADIAHMSPVPTDPYMYTHTHTHTHTRTHSQLLWLLQWCYEVSTFHPNTVTGIRVRCYKGSLTLHAILIWSVPGSVGEYWVQTLSLSTRCERSGLELPVLLTRARHEVSHAPSRHEINVLQLLPQTNKAIIFSSAHSI